MSNTYGITVDETALRRIAALRSGDHGPGMKLRVAVEGGGCSGFQYRIEPTTQINGDDIVLGDAVVIDEMSAPYLKNSVIKFQDNLMSAMFVIDNPNAVSSCGCSASFAVDPSKI